MNVVSIEIIDDIALQELEDMEKRNLIKLKLDKDKAESASKKFWGRLSDNTTRKLHSHIKKSRKEWSNI